MSATGVLPLISIPLCTYNGEKYLAEQLDSLLAQTHTNFEVLAFDDASSDESVAILQQYAQRDARIKIHVNPQNIGFAGNFSQALRACTGEYIAPCDQDDIWRSEKVARLLEAIGVKPLAYCNSSIVDEAGKSLGCRMSDFVGMRDLSDPVAFVFDNCVSGHASLFRRELLSMSLPVPEAFFYDHWIAAVATVQGGVVFCPELLVDYRQHGDSVTNFYQVRTRNQVDRTPGFRLKSWRVTGARFQALSELPGRHQKLCAQLAASWRRRESDWISLKLCWLLFRNEKRLHVLHSRSSIDMFTELKRWLIGIRLKRLFRPYPYTEH